MGIRPDMKQKEHASLFLLALPIVSSFGVNVMDPAENTNLVSFAQPETRSVNKGHDRFFIPYIFKRSADMDSLPSQQLSNSLEELARDPVDMQTLEDMWKLIQEQDFFANFPRPINQFNNLQKRGASQYYLLHFGMPGAGARGKNERRRSERNSPFFS